MIGVYDVLKVIIGAGMMSCGLWHIEQREKPKGTLAFGLRLAGRRCGVKVNEAESVKAAVSHYDRKLREMTLMTLLLKCEARVVTARR
ncbi:unnamed protein product [Pleuronectes platessa]|uniref:Uncharacterized protein n=1 Tax=Pleuronectes platessa TaxID=8262 RepID=A0A9N7TJV2_PLEPL|nr:unnamed protein product [Pleuronectes platessa]